MSEKWMQVDHIALHAFRTLPRHCNGQGAKDAVIGKDGKGIVRIGEIMTMHEENVNIQDGALSIFNKVLDEKSIMYLSKVSTRKLKKAKAKMNVVKNMGK